LGKIRASGAQFNGHTDAARDLLAKYIVELALEGERNRAMTHLRRA
jgi:hypothetical protein